MAKKDIKEKFLSDNIEWILGFICIFICIFIFMYSCTNIMQLDNIITGKVSVIKDINEQVYNNTTGEIFFYCSFLICFIVMLMAFSRASFWKRRYVNYIKRKKYAKSNITINK